MPLTNLTRVKLHLGITDNGEDALLQQLMSEAEAAVKLFTRRRLDQHTITNEYYDGPGRQVLILNQRPVTSVVDVRVDANGMSGQSATGFDSNSVWTQGVDFYARRLTEDEKNPGELIAAGSEWGSVWPEGIGNIRVSYVAGYSTIPEDVQYAVHSLIARMREDQEHGRPVISETLGSYSYSLLSGKAEGQEMTSARSALLKYRSIVI